VRLIKHLRLTNHCPTLLPGYWIQISGSSLFSTPEIKEARYGAAGGKFYDDLKDAEEIRAIIKSTPTRIVDNLVISQSPSSIKTALIVGPLIYGTGRGPGNTRSIQAPEIARVTLQEKQGFRVGQGLSAWSNIHIRDLSLLIVKLVEAAATGREGLWNEEGLYLPENGYMVSISCDLIWGEQH